MQLGDRVRTRVPLPGIRAGAIGRVKEIGRLFVVVEFPDGRIGYYASQQLEQLPSPAATRPAPGPDEVALGLDDLRVPAGSHLCLLPAHVREAMEVAARFLAAGLEAEERCVCALPKSRMNGFRSAMEELSAGSPAIPWDGLALIDVREFYLNPEAFLAEKQIERLAEIVASIAGEEKIRFRAFGYMGPALDELDPGEWWQYEVQVTPLCKQLDMTAICGYAPSRSRKESERWRRAADVHPYVVRRGEVVPGGRSRSQ